MEITKDILTRAAQQTKDILERHKDTINESFQNSQEILEIGLKLRLSWVDGKLKIATKSRFSKGVVKDEAISWYDPDQKMLFDD